MENTVIKYTVKGTFHSGATKVFVEDLTHDELAKYLANNTNLIWDLYRHTLSKIYIEYVIEY